MLSPVGSSRPTWPASGSPVNRIQLIVPEDAGHLVALVYFENEVRNREDIARQVHAVLAEIGVVDHHLGEGVALELGQEVGSGEAVQVVEPVAVLQVFHLRLEDEVEGRAEKAAEGLLLFGEAADPQVDIVKARVSSIPGAGGTQEVDAVRIGYAADGHIDRIAAVAEYKQSCRRSLLLQSGCGQNGGMQTVGRNEIDHRQLVLGVLGEIDPALVRLQLLVAGAGIELGARLVEGRRTSVAGAGDVEHRKVERQAEQVVAQRVDDELVDLVANLAGRAANDGARRFIGGSAWHRTGPG